MLARLCSLTRPRSGSPTCHAPDLQAWLRANHFADCCGPLRDFTLGQLLVLEKADIVARMERLGISKLRALILYTVLHLGTWHAVV